MVKEHPVFRVTHAKTTLFFGVKVVADKLERLVSNNERILVITGRNSAMKSGALQDVKEVLKANNAELEVVSGVPPNPGLQQCEDIVGKSSDGNFTSVMAIGGGSVIDTAKVVASALGDKTDCDAFVNGKREPAKPLPLYAVNLTHGTGSEIDRYAVINVPDKRIKKGFPIIYPSYSFDDPRYTLTLPRFHTIITTFDAFYHSYESATSPRTNPLVQDLAEKAVHRISLYLRRALNEPDSLKARYELLYASMIAGIAIDYAGTHIIHLIEHGLSGVNDKLEHAAGLAIIGPALIPYIHRAIPAQSYSILRSISADIRPLPTSSEDASRAVKMFQESMGFDRNLGDYGFDKSDIDEAVEKVWPLAVKYWGEKPFGLSMELVKTLLYKLV